MGLWSGINVRIVQHNVKAYMRARSLYISTHVPVVRPRVREGGSFLHSYIIPYPVDVIYSVGEGDDQGEEDGIS